MKILLIHNFYQQQGGENVYVKALNKLLRINGNKVITYFKYSTSITDKLKTARDMFYNRKMIDELTTLIHKKKPDIAHIHNIYPLLTPAVYAICARYKVPIVQTIHSYRILCAKGTLLRNNAICHLCISKKFAYPAGLFGCYHQSHIASWLFAGSAFYHNWHHRQSLVNHYIFPAAFTQSFHLKHTNIAQNKTSMIPYFVPQPRKTSSLTQKRYFVFVGRLAEEKGILHLLKIFSEIPQASLLVIGDGPLFSQVKAFEKFSNINVLRDIPHSRVYSYMRKALCTIIPSPWYEVGPLVLLESYACGTPVIVPKIGVFAERVKENKTGFFYSLSSHSSFKSCVLRALKNRHLLTSMGINAKAEYDQLYTPQKHYQLLITAYKQTIKSYSLSS